MLLVVVMNVQIIHTKNEEEEEGANISYNIPRTCPKIYRDGGGRETSGTVILMITPETGLHTRGMSRMHKRGHQCVVVVVVAWTSMCTG